MDTNETLIKRQFNKNKKEKKMGDSVEKKQIEKMKLGQLIEREQILIQYSNKGRKSNSNKHF